MASNMTFLNIINNNKNDISTIKEILENNKDLINLPFEDNKENNIIHSPLTYCIEKKLDEISIFLIEVGADVNYKIPFTEDYPIHLACRYRQLEVVKKLLSRSDININCLNKKNETCFYISLNNSDVSIYSLLITYFHNLQKKTKNIISNAFDINNENSFSTSTSKDVYLNKKKKTFINNLSVDVPFNYGEKLINGKIGKFYFINYFKLNL